MEEGCRSVCQGEALEGDIHMAFGGFEEDQGMWARQWDPSPKPPERKQA
jgi:hypothetical protein